MSFSSNTKVVKRSLNLTSRMGQALVLLLPVTLFSYCGKSEKPVYETSADREYMGSVFYAKSDCVTCHGPEWNGQGADAKRMNASGLKVTDFTAADKASKTPLDYFKAITAPEDYFKAKPGVDEWDMKIFVSNHKYLTYTDKARWKIANFLYNLGQGNSDPAKMAEMRKEAAANYSTHRRWELWDETVEKRNHRPELDDLVKKAGYRFEKGVQPAGGQVSDERMAVYAEDGTGARLYKDNCAECHGNYAEGKKGIRYGLNGMIPILSGYPRVGDGPERQKPVEVTTGQMPAMGLDAFKSAHNGSDMMTPDLSSLTGEGWQDLHSYTMRLAGN